MSKLPNDKYYTPLNLARYCINKTFKVVGKRNISEVIEPSAGNGSFSLQIPDCIAYDIEPEHSTIIKQDYLNLDIPYKKGRLIIGNPPFGRSMCLARKFFKKSVSIADFIAFILPISQLNNRVFLYEFDLIYSKDLGKHLYSNRKLHCCFNIYQRPLHDKLNSKPATCLKDVTIIRQDSPKYDEIVDYDVRMCRWGDGTAGKILARGESYAGEFKIVVNNDTMRESIVHCIANFSWNNYLKGLAAKSLQKYHIVEVLKEHIPDIK